MVDIQALVKKPTFLLKLVELFFAIICTGLVADDIPVGYNLSKIAVIYVTIIGYMLIGVIVILAYFLDSPLHNWLLVLIGGTGFFMWITAGSLMCEFYADTRHTLATYINTERLLASGILALINCLFYALDTAFSVMGALSVSVGG